MEAYNLQVTIDKDSGFCFGVIYAIDMAEDILAEDGYLYCLGDIVHNDEEVARLEEKGLRIIDHDALKDLRPAVMQRQPFGFQHHPRPR